MATPEKKFLKDYRTPDYYVDAVNLDIALFEDYAEVIAILDIYKNQDHKENDVPLLLDGKALELLSVKIDGDILPENLYQIKDGVLSISKVPEKFRLETRTRILPHQNTSLEGLYVADGIFLTQCEAEGFRRITYFPDRPDVMSTYRVKISADKNACPVLLSNGNLVEKGDLENGRHFAVWEDPFRKPCYLFALVAGDLACVESTYTTMSGKNVDLKFYVDKKDADKCDHAISSLKKAMKWDEDVFGLSYDLDTYMIVSTHAFNAGAMENKGLNVFNSKYVLAKKETATDTDFQQIEGVIAHEYFHNWTGNRVTLNSWFQLSLKEGLTVFRDQEFSSDMESRAIKRISDVRGLRASQFPEDSGPMAHPVRPESYIEMNNFYTATVYNKGAEVIRMIHTLIGPEKFRKGMDLYFKRFDGKAVTTEDFVKSMEDAGEKDLSLFRLWYSQAGTPQITVERNYDPEKKTFSLTFTQKIPDTPGQKDKKPMHIPVKTGLIGPDGKDIPLYPEGGKEALQGETEMVLELKKEVETFTFRNVDNPPVPSVFRGFSAPVVSEANYTDEELMFLMANDADSFNRWDATQQLFLKTILSMVCDLKEGKELRTDARLVDAFRKTLLNKDLDKALIAEALSLPTETEIGDKSDEIDVDGIHTARDFLIRDIAGKLKNDFANVFEENGEKGTYDIDPFSISRRKLKNLALFYLSRVEDENNDQMVYDAFSQASNMTDEISAFSTLSGMETDYYQKAVDMFYEKWKEDTLVLDKWFSVQAAANRSGTHEEVIKLTNHPDFSIKNPNKVRSLIGVFCQGNPWNFHQKDGKGYRFLADTVISLNALNPHIAARMASLFNKWKRYDSERRALMKGELQRILEAENLAKGVYEIVSRAIES